MKHYCKIIYEAQRYQTIFCLYFAVAAIEALIALIAILRVPADVKYSVLFSYSYKRLVLASAMVVSFCVSIGMSAICWFDRKRAEQLRDLIFGQEKVYASLTFISGIGLGLGWVATFLPAYRFNDFASYYIRFRPAVIFITTLSAQTLIPLIIWRYGFHWNELKNKIKTHQRALPAFAITLAVFILIWGLMAWCGLGVLQEKYHWYEAGVPILGLQLLLAWGIGIGVHYFEYRNKRRLTKNSTRKPAWWISKIDLLICLALWLITAFYWAREPIQSSFFAPGPYLPNNEFAPYSDATLFDLGSQFALIGQGINNGAFFDRGLYMGFLELLHSIIGQRYSDVMALQAGLYAVLPMILYLIGKSIHSKSLGITLAVITMFRGLNSIAAATMINSTNPKHMLTGFPTAIGVALVTLGVIKWLKEPKKKYQYALLSGGMLGLTMLVRTNALLILPFVLFTALLVYGRSWRLWILTIILFILSMFISTAPWAWRNGQIPGFPFHYIYVARIESVTRGRYIPTISPTSQAKITPSVAETMKHQEQEFPLMDITPITPPESIPSEANIVDAAMEKVEGVIHRYDGVAHFVSSHFFHNLLTSVLILPTSVISDDLQHTLREANPYWIEHWDGSIHLGAKILLLLNLAIIAIGVGASWERLKIPALIPLVTFLSYNLANAFGRTSGGRYIVPVDWVVLLYFGCGLIQITRWIFVLLGLNVRFTSDGTAENKNLHLGAQRCIHPFWKSVLILIAILLIGALLPLSENIFPPRYEQLSKEEVLEILDHRGAINKAGFDLSEIETFLDDENAQAYSGRLVYPRFFYHNQGIPGNAVYLNPRDYPRLTFTYIGPFGAKYAVLPIQEIPDNISNASDVAVLVCSRDALMIVIYDNENPAKDTVLVRSPESPLNCPLREPVCDDNHICR